MERKEIPALQVLISQVCQETEEVPASQVPQEQWEPQDLLVALDGMACLEGQVRKETWVQWDLQDLLEDQVAQEDLAVRDLKVNLDTRVEMAHLVVLVLKETGVILVSREPLDPRSHHSYKREPKETQDFQVYRVFRVRKVFPVSLVILACRDQMVALDSLDHQVLREILASQVVQVVLELQEPKAAWEKWDFQDHQGRRVYQVSQVGQEGREGPEHPVSPELKVNQVLLELDNLDPVDSRVNQASQGSQEAQDLKELQDLLVSQAYQVDQVSKVTPASPDSKVLLVSQALKVLTVHPAVPVSLELPGGPESLADLEVQEVQERKVRQDVTVSQDQLESRESQVLLVMAAPVLLVFQVCQALRETPVFLAPLAVLVSLVLKEMLASLVPLVLEETPALLGLQDWLCKDPKDSKVPLDHLDAQVDPAHRVPVDLKEVAVLKARRVFPALLASLASPGRRESLVVQDSRVPLVFLVALV